MWAACNITYGCMYEYTDLLFAVLRPELASENLTYTNNARSSGPHENTQSFRPQTTDTATSDAPVYGRTPDREIIKMMCSIIDSK